MRLHICIYLLISWVSYTPCITISLKDTHRDLNPKEIDTFQTISNVIRNAYASNTQHISAHDIENDSVTFIYNNASTINKISQSSHPISHVIKPNNNVLARQLFEIPLSKLINLIKAAQILDIPLLHTMSVYIYANRAFSNIELRSMIRGTTSLIAGTFDTHTQKKIIKNINQIHELQKLYHEHINTNIAHGNAAKKTIFDNKLPILDLTWHKHANVCALADKKEIKILTMPNGKVIHTIPVSHIPNKLAWAPHDTFLAIGYINGMIDIYSAQSGKKVTTLSMHTDAITGIDWRIDQRFLVSGSYDKTARIWDTRTWKLAYTHTQTTPIHAIACNPFEKEIALGTQTTDMILKIGLKNPIHQYQTTHPIHTVSWSPDSHEFLIGSHSKEIDLIIQPEWKKISIPTHHIYNITCAAWSPNSRYIATGSSDGTIEMIDAIKQKPIRMLTMKHKSLSAISWGPDGTYLAAGDASGKLILWKFMDKEFIKLLHSLTPTQMQLIVAIKRKIIQPFRSSIYARVSKKIGREKIHIPFNLPEHLHMAYIQLPQEIKYMLEQPLYHNA